MGICTSRHVTRHRGHRHNNATSSSQNNTPKESKNSTKTHEQLLRRYQEHVDGKALIVFPIAFFLFNIGYWFHYLMNLWRGRKFERLTTAKTAVTRGGQKSCRGQNINRQSEWDTLWNSRICGDNKCILPVYFLSFFDSFSGKIWSKCAKESVPKAQLFFQKTEDLVQGKKHFFPPYMKFKCKPKNTLCFFLLLWVIHLYAIPWFQTKAVDDKVKDFCTLSSTVLKGCNMSFYSQTKQNKKCFLWMT